MISYNDLKIDCKNCFGLCCVALNFSKIDGFPNDKSIGEPCENLDEDFKCIIHGSDKYEKMRGCIGYDCFGAGQRISSEIYKGISWKDNRDISKEIFSVFIIIQELHEFLWYLLDAFRFSSSKKSRNIIEGKIEYIEEIIKKSPKDIKEVDLNLVWENIKEDLFNVAITNSQKYCELGKSKIKVENKILNRPDFMGKDFENQNIKGEDLSGAFLISANLSGCSLDGCNLLGADLRDCNFRGSDLSNGIFLTQRQINSAVGDNDTILPENIEMPCGWRNK